MVDKDFIFASLKRNILLILPELEQSPISMSDSLKELGANSIDRAEIIVQTAAELMLQIPLVRFAEAKNIDELVDIFYSSANSK